MSSTVICTHSGSKGRRRSAHNKPVNTVDSVKRQTRTHAVLLHTPYTPKSYHGNRTITATNILSFPPSSSLVVLNRNRGQNTRSEGGGRGGIKQPFLPCVPYAWWVIVFLAFALCCTRVSLGVASFYTPTQALPQVQPVADYQKSFIVRLKAVGVVEYSRCLFRGTCGPMSDY